ncbi:MAG: hypothetical protein D6719_07305 [Candidatus Dadabacteria bacterium]|nr:MAG: hypothetical protein D6719_07305 [Candidatus Dadabacteria bacterium]
MLSCGIQLVLMTYPYGKFYLWDPWFIQENGSIHMFHLKAPCLQNPELRDDSACIGHAITYDFHSWQELEDAIFASEGGWDNLSIWTGSTIKHDGRFYLFYTGRHRSTPLVQHIGLAVSEDLITFERVSDKPVLSADGEIYCKKARLDYLQNPPAWRDPFVFREKSGKYIMLITARDASRPAPYNACIGAAHSSNLIEWELLPPLLSPGIFAEMETPQLVEDSGNYYLFFSCKKSNVNPISPFAGTGTYMFSSKQLFGDYTPWNDKSGYIDLGDSSVYNFKIIQKAGKQSYALGWRAYDKNGNFAGALSKPYEVSFLENRIKITPAITA